MGERFLYFHLIFVNELLLRRISCSRKNLIKGGGEGGEGGEGGKG